MPDLADGEQVEVQGSAKDPYVLKNTGGVYSCSCPAWRNKGGPIDKRTCKHLKALRGEEAENARIGGASGGSATSTNTQASKPAASTSVKASKAAAGDDDGGDSKSGAPVLLAHKWENDVDLTGWWMSEKLDGVRAYWNGKQFISRLGNPFFAPAWFTQGLPDTPLDGELWGGRKKFQETISVVRSADGGNGWKWIRYVVFDAPHLQDPFEERVQYLKDTLDPKKGLQYADAHVHELCKGVAHLKTELARVEALGGEGLMLRKPGSKYEVGRSSTLLKVKSFHDADATVIAHEPGKGKHKGRLGALVVQMPDGTKFNIGTGFSDKERESPPGIGTIVTYRYQELTKDGVPRFPSYVGLRIDGPATMPK